MWFTEHPIRNWRDAERYANEPRFARWYQEMFMRGVLFHPSQYENLFVSLVTTDEDIDATLAAAEESFKVLAAKPPRLSRDEGSGQHAPVRPGQRP